MSSKTAPPAAGRAVGSLHSGLRPSFLEPTLFYYNCYLFENYCNLLFQFAKMYDILEVVKSNNTLHKLQKVILK